MADEGQEGVRVVQALDLPEGAILQSHVFVVAYFDEEGKSKYAFTVEGGESVAQSIGLLELVKAHMLSSTTFASGDDE